MSTALSGTIAPVPPFACVPPQTGTIVRVTIDSRVRVPLAGLSRDLLQRLHVLFSRDVPDRGQGRGRKKGQQEKIKAWSTEDGWDGEELILPRGQASLVLKQLQLAGLQPEVAREVCDGEPLDGVRFLGQLRGYQQACVGALVNRVQGLVVGGCGMGKTEVGCAAIAEVGRSALILVHTLDLAEQWRQRIQLRLGVQAGLVGDGVRDIRPITVASLQTLANWSAPEVATFGARFGVVVVDECHHLPSDLMSKAVNALPCRWRWGLTATPRRPDGMDFVLSWVLGPVLHVVEQQQLIAAGHLLAAEVYEVESWGTIDWPELSTRYATHRQQEMEKLQTRMKAMAESARLELTTKVRKVRWPGDFVAIGIWAAKKVAALEVVRAESSSIVKMLARTHEGKNGGYWYDGDAKLPDWAMDALYWQSMVDQDRNRLILRVIQFELARDSQATVLVLCNRKEHCELLVRMATDAGIGAAALTSEKKTLARQDTLQRLRTGELRVATATALADEGLDVPRLTAVVLAASARAEGRTEQRLGRAMRPAPGKPTPRLYDVVDEKIGIFRAQYVSRMKAYRKVLGDKCRPKKWCPDQLELAAPAKEA